MKQQIESLEQLRAEIHLLKVKKAEHELFFEGKKDKFKQTFSSPINFVKGVGHYFGIGSNLDTNSLNAKTTDWVTHLSRVVIPFIINQTVLKGKGKLLKSLFSLVSQKAIKPSFFNQDTISNYINKATDFINSTLKKNKPSKVSTVDYGIPPDSETY